MPSPARQPSAAAPTSAIPFLVAMMLATGVANTILTKFQDMQCVRNCDAPDPRQRHNFEQPVLQTAQMFVGELGCFLIVGGMAVHKRWKASRPSTTARYQALDTDDNEDNDTGASSPTAVDGDEHADHAESASSPKKADFLRGYRKVLLALPAICDICGTTLMNVGLLLVAASIYQMTRGALVLFVALLSVVYLKRRLHLFQWVSLVGVVTGVAIVGLAGAIQPDKKHPDAAPESGGGPGSATMVTLMGRGSVAIENDALRAVVGVTLIACAQIFTATQFVLEERFLEESTMSPMAAAGWEGLFGLLVTVTGMVVLHQLVGRTEAGRYGYFDMKEGFRQMLDNKKVLLSSFMIMITIG